MALPGRMNWNGCVELSSGGGLRASGPEEARALVLLVPGGTAASRAGRWSANLTWLAPRIRRAVGPDVRIVQVRYRDSSWRSLEGPTADVRAAIELEARTPAGTPRRTVLVGFSMGGGVCLAAAGDVPELAGIVGIAPWFPAGTPWHALVGKPLDVVHGSLDGALPLIPGVHPSSSFASVINANRAGVDASWESVAGGIHGLAVRLGELPVPLPRARRFARLVTDRVVRQLALEA